MELSFVLWSFFLLRLLLCIPINLPYSHAWNNFVMSGLVLLVPTWNCWISYKNRYAHRQNVASLNLFYKYYFGRCSSNINWHQVLAQLFPLHYSRGRSTRYSDRLHDFSVTIPRYYKHFYVNSFFICTARLWNSLPIECFPLTYDLSGLKSRININLLTVISF